MPDCALQWRGNLPGRSDATPGLKRTEPEKREIRSDPRPPVVKPLLARGFFRPSFEIRRLCPRALIMPAISGMPALIFPTRSGIAGEIRSIFPRIPSCPVRSRQTTTAFFRVPCGHEGDLCRKTMPAGLGRPSVVVFFPIFGINDLHSCRPAIAAVRSWPRPANLGGAGWRVFASVGRH